MKSAGGVPIGRRQLTAEPAKLIVALAAVAAAVALVLLLTGLRRGIGEQVTIYLDRQPPVLVGQAGTRDFLSQSSVLLPETISRVERVAGVADAAPITEGYAMLALHDKRILTVLVGYDPGRRGGPWKLAAGRAPRALDEVVFDRLLADEHGLAVGSTLHFRGSELRIVGLSSGTSGFMTPLLFSSRETANALNELPGTATFLLVTPKPGFAPVALARRVETEVPGVSANLREALAANDRDLFVSAFAGPLRAMVLIAAAVAVLVIALTVYSSTRDRGKEYATLKTLGLRHWALMRLAAGQAGAIAVSGSALGVLLAAAAARAVAELAPRYLIVVTGSDIARITVASLVFAIVAALVPARYLARLDPATAFRR